MHNNLRPKLHFAAQENWINDPNGLVFYEGEWHLFFQYNPYGTEWGNMNWGHAVSRDLINWQELSIAIHEDDEAMIFSGSCVIDWENTSGLGDGTKPPMIAIYTAHAKSRELQTQCIAYSLDRGRTFIKYSGNPVLDINKADFRDPKVFWHDPSMSWKMIVANSKDNTVSFYSSPNLKDWLFLSEFGNCGAKGNLWECPDIFELQDKDGQTRWVLKIDVFSFEDEQKSICQYFVGNFDGTNFIPDCDDDGNPIWNFADFGHDFYAAVSFSDIPEAQNRKIWLGWMNSHHYAKNTPTSPWRGAMTIPRELGICRTSKGYKLIQKPISEVAQFLRPTANSENIDKFSLGIYEQTADSSRSFEIVLSYESGEEFRFSYNAQTRTFHINRAKSFLATSIPELTNYATANRISLDAEIQIMIIIDRFSLEIFVDGGIQVFSEICFSVSEKIKINYQSNYFEQILKLG